MFLSREEMFIVMGMVIIGLGLIVPFIIQYVTRDSRSSSGKSVHKFFNGVFWFFFLIAGIPFSAIVFALAGNALVSKNWIDSSVMGVMKKLGIALVFIVFFPFSVIVYVLYKISEHRSSSSSPYGTNSSSDEYSGSGGFSSSDDVGMGEQKQYHTTDGTVVTVYSDGRVIDNKGNSGYVANNHRIEFNNGDINFLNGKDIHDSDYKWRGKQ